MSNNHFTKLKVLAIAVEQNTILASKDNANPISIAPGEIEELTTLINSMGRMESLIKSGVELNNGSFSVNYIPEKGITLKRIVGNESKLSGIKWDEIDSIIDDLNEAVKIFIDRVPKQNRTPNSQYQPFNS